MEEQYYSIGCSAHICTDLKVCDQKGCLAGVILSWIRVGNNNNISLTFILYLPWARPSEARKHSTRATLFNSNMVPHLQLTRSFGLILYTNLIGDSSACRVSSSPFLPRCEWCWSGAKPPFALSFEFGVSLETRAHGFLKEGGIWSSRQDGPSLLTIGQWDGTSGSPISSSRERWGDGARRVTGGRERGCVSVCVCVCLVIQLIWS